MKKSTIALIVAFIVLVVFEIAGVLWSTNKLIVENGEVQTVPADTVCLPDVRSDVQAEDSICASDSAVAGEKM